jgi:LPS-assembly protein
VGNLGPVSGSITYAFLRAQPDFGVLDVRSEIQFNANWQITEAVRLFGSVRIDLINESFVRNGLGIAYDQEEFSVSLAYFEDRARGLGTTIDQTFLLSFGLRTLGDGQAALDLLL